MEDRTEQIKVHFRYWVCILTAIIICTATDRWSDKPEFTTYLSNAATLTSLVLGLVAIFYSFISNDGLSQGLGNINTVATTVNETREEISKYLELTRSAASATQENVISLSAASTEVQVGLLELNETLKKIGLQTSSLHDAVGLIPPRLDQLEKNVMDTAKILGTKDLSSTGEHAKDSISTASAMRFLEASAVVVNLLTYACVLALRSRKKISLTEIGTVVGIDPGYLVGNLACQESMKIITTGAIAEKWDMREITEVHPTLVSETEKYLFEYLNRKRISDTAKFDDWIAKANKIRSLYEK